MPRLLVLLLLSACGTPQPIEPFAPTTARWTADHDWAWAGDAVTFTLELTWPQPFPSDDLVIHVLEDCDDSACSWTHPEERFTWNGSDGAEHVRVMDPQTVFSPDRRYGTLTVGADLSVCTREAPVTCATITPEPASVTGVWSPATAVHLPEEEVTLAVGERRALSAWPVTRTWDDGRLDTVGPLIPTPEQVTWRVEGGETVAVQDGVLEGLAVGQAVVIASVGDVESALRVRVVDQALSDVPFEGFHPLGPYPLAGLISSRHSRNRRLVGFPPEGAPQLAIQGGATWFADEPLPRVDAYAPLVLSQWTGTGWSRERVTSWDEPIAEWFLAMGGDGHTWLGYTRGVGEGLVLLDRPADAAPGSAWRRTILDAALPGDVGETALLDGVVTPEIATLPADGGLWVAAHLYVGLSPDEAGAQAAGIRSNCLRVLRLWRVEDGVVTHQDVQVESLGLDFHQRCGDLHAAIDPYHNLSMVFLAPMEDGPPALLTERGGVLDGSETLGVLTTLSDPDIEPVWALQPSELDLLRVHTWDGSAWLEQAAAATPETTVIAARALTQSDGVASDEPIWDEGRWAPFADTRLRMGFSAPGMGAWLRDANLPVPNLLRHILPHGGELRDTPYARVMDTTFPSTTLTTPDDGTDSFTSLTGGHGWVGWITQGPEGDTNLGLWLTRFEGLAPTADAPLAEGRQLVEADTLDTPARYQDGHLVFSGSAPPVHRKAVPLTDGRVGLLGTGHLPLEGNDTVQRVGDAGQDEPLWTLCTEDEASILAVGDDLLQVCSSWANGANAEVVVRRLAAADAAWAVDATWPGGGQVLAALGTPDGSAWVLRGAGLDQLAPDGVHTLHILPAALVAPPRSDEMLLWGMWPDGDGFLLVRVLPGYWSTEATRTLAFWSWQPDTGFASAWTGEVPMPPTSSGLDVFPARGALLGSRWLLTTRVGPFASDDGGVTWTPLTGDWGTGAGVGIWGEGAVGVVPVGSGAAWVSEQNDEPGLSRVQVHWTDDGHAWTSPEPALDNGSGFQHAWAAVGTSDGRLLLALGDSRGPGVRDPSAYAQGTAPPSIGRRNTPLLHEIVVALEPPTP
ncbi:MAG: hypothetical protein H6734_15095 [Alphaproteobacteria bacterium]|nr:hypothetical protein [Alphaproteobacteria bacterium]